MKSLTALAVKQFDDTPLDHIIPTFKVMLDSELGTVSTGKT